MPTRRNVLLGAGALVAGGGAVLGTGAFTTVQAERTVEVETAGDSNAFLVLEPAQDSDGNQYPNAQEFADGGGNTLEVVIGEGDAGVNLNAITHIDRVFQVTNNGTQSVVVYFEEISGDDTGGNAIDIGARTDQLDVDDVGGNNQPSTDGIDDTEIVDLSYPAPPDGPNSPGYEELGVLVGEGETLEVGVYIDTTDANLNDGLSESGSEDFDVGDLLIENLVVYADAAAADSNEYYTEVDP